MYPHKHNLLFIFIVLLSFQTIEAKNTENKSTDLNSKNTTTVSDFSNILNSPINTFNQNSEQQADAAEYEEYDSSKIYDVTGTLVIYNCSIWKSKNYVNKNSYPGKGDAWEFIEYYDQGDCTFYNGVLEYDNTMKYTKAGIQVYYNCSIWKSKDYVNKNSYPGKGDAWEFVEYYDQGDCTFYNGVLEYDSTMKYTKAGMQVYYNCMIWENRDYIGKNSFPGQSENWEFVEYYDGGDCTFYNGVLEYDNTMKYTNAGMQVYYNGKIWVSKWYASQNQIPGKANVWEFVEDYILYNDAEKYIEEVVYQPETEVYFNCTLWKKVDNSPAGTAPGADNDAWEFVEYYENSNECTFIDGVPEYDDTMTYLPGMEVYYDGNVWVNNTTNQKISGDTPNFIDSEWSAKNSSTLSVADDILKENITLYYNSNRIYYDFSKLENSSQIVCYDVKGSMIFSKEINNDKDAIDLPSIQQGLYFLQVLNNNAKTFKKIIVL